MDSAYLLRKVSTELSGIDIVGFIKEEEQFRKKEAPPEIRISRGALIINYLA
jgi:hypothetical protein